MLYLTVSHESHPTVVYHICSPMKEEWDKNIVESQNCPLSNLKPYRTLFSKCASNFIAALLVVIDSLKTGTVLLMMGVRQNKADTSADITHLFKLM